MNTWEASSMMLITGLTLISVSGFTAGIEVPAKSNQWK
jgi:hypothetical protein